MRRYIIYFFASFTYIYANTIEYFSYEDNKSVPYIDSFELRYKNQNLICYPTQIIRKKTKKDLVSFSCIKKDIPIEYIPQEQQVSYKEQQGRDETKKLKLQIKDKENIGMIYKVDIPLSETNSKWRKKSIAKHQLNNTYYIKYLQWMLPAKFYISIRPQISNTQDNKSLKLRDNGSRAGFFYYYIFDNGWELTTQYEATIDWHDVSSFINLSTQSNTTRRLSYISISYDNYTILAGKYWSAYYDIAQYTDMFMAYGALSSGAFNNKSDGSYSGTGRADYLIQFHIDDIKYDATFQIQTKHKGAKELDSRYRYGISASYQYTFDNNIKLGSAFAFGKFEKITPYMKTVGINGDDISWIGGISYTKKRYKLNTTISYTKNHMCDNEGVYFDGYGVELYMHYDYNTQFRIAGGYNYLKPKYNYQHKSAYKISDTILSLQYTFNASNFDDMIYMEISIPSGNLANQTKPNTSISIGFRYLISL